VITGYALSLKASGAVRSPDFVVSSPMRGELLRRLADRKINLDSLAVRTTAPLLDRLLVQQVDRYLFGTKAEFARALRDDKMVQTAVDLLARTSSQKDALTTGSRP
jgi:hypothetical protein